MRSTCTMILCLILAGCAQKNGLKNTADINQLQSATINYNDAIRGLHLEYPADWTEQGVPASGQVLLILQLPETSTGGGFPPTLQLSSQNKGGRLELAQVESAVIERGQNSLKNFQLLGNVPTALGGEPAKQIICKGVSSGIAVQTMTVITIHHGQGFAISFAAGPGEFEQHLPAVQRVLASLTFTK